MLSLGKLWEILIAKYRIENLKNQKELSVDWKYHHFMVVMVRNLSIASFAQPGNLFGSYHFEEMTLLIFCYIVKL